MCMDLDPCGQTFAGINITRRQEQSAVSARTDEIQAAHLAESSTPKCHIFGLIFGREFGRLFDHFLVEFEHVRLAIEKGLREEV